MRRRTILFFIISAIIFVVSSCNGLNKVQITDISIDSMSMTSMRTADVGLKVCIYNPGGKLDFRQVDGVLMHFGKVIGKVSLDPFIVSRKTMENHHLSAKVSLDEKMRFFQLMEFANKKKLDECTVDIQIKAYASGIPMQKNIKEVPLKKLLQL